MPLAAAVSLKRTTSAVSQGAITLCLLVSSADNLCKQFGPRSGSTFFGPDLFPNCLQKATLVGGG